MSVLARSNDALQGNIADSLMMIVWSSGISENTDISANKQQDSLITYTSFHVTIVRVWNAIENCDYDNDTQDETRAAGKSSETGLYTWLSHSGQKLTLKDLQKTGSLH